MSGIFDRRAKRFISTEQAERAVPSRTVMASRGARDDVNRSESIAEELSTIGEEREAKVEALQQILDERQE